MQHHRQLSTSSSSSSATSTTSSSPQSSPGPTRRRPLPRIPHPLACKTCRSCITSTDVILRQADIPSARGFKGFAGKASLFSEVYHVTMLKPGVHLMSTGAHTMREIVCASCETYLGWKIERAHNRSERWKEGYHLLELENLYAGKHETQILHDALKPKLLADSDSDYSS
ncbi:hypothetical protein ONZ45_g5605 [Pleurotus djamor]|nr:hypothetical protein ONZ45_g13869 [Pleurotus djamor]KAJ8517150.1 hypothetical protein ONZ45_g5605 [Pleurotus djamor]